MLVDYDQFKDICYSLLKRISTPGKKYRAVMCPLRGGFYLSDFMSRHLNIPMIYIEISSYSGMERRGFHIGTPPDLEQDLFLLCDDIYDSGNTVRKIHELYPHVNFETACLVSKVKDPDIFYGLHACPDEWVDFFWEVM